MVRNPHAGMFVVRKIHAAPFGDSLPGTVPGPPGSEREAVSRLSDEAAVAARPGGVLAAAMSESRVLYLLGSAAPPVLHVAEVIKRAQRDGWDVCLGLTPTAARWLEEEAPALAELTGHPVRSRYKLPREPDVWPRADVALLAPATFNTINQWALGITTLRSMGVRVLDGEGGFVPNEPGQGRPDAYPWHLALNAARELVEERA